MHGILCDGGRGAGAEEGRGAYGVDLASSKVVDANVKAFVGDVELQLHQLALLMQVHNLRAHFRSMDQPRN